MNKKAQATFEYLIIFATIVAATIIFANVLSPRVTGILRNLGNFF